MNCFERAQLQPCRASLLVLSSRGDFSRRGICFSTGRHGGSGPSLNSYSRHGFSCAANAFAARLHPAAEPRCAFRRGGKPAFDAPHDQSCGAAFFTAIIRFAGAQLNLRTDFEGARLQPCRECRLISSCRAGFSPRGHASPARRCRIPR